MKGRVLVAGFTTRHVAQSAHRAGYDVCVVDHFCDQDLYYYTSDQIRFEELEDLPDAIDQMSRKHRFDFMIPTSGAEDLPFTIPVWGTPAGKVSRFLDKLETQHFFEAQNLTVPALKGKGSYPFMIKPRRSSGGWRNTVIHNAQEQAAWDEEFGSIPAIRQEFIDGIPASVCCITNGIKAQAVAVNQQILRSGKRGLFGFCGSITPITHSMVSRMTTYAEQAAAASGCLGTIGVDFVLSQEKCHVIEINPRFQGTIDTVEMATGCNLFSLHVRACHGSIEPHPIPARQVAVRNILFAERDMTLRAELKHLFPVIADIPWPGTFFEKDQAIVSVYGWGNTQMEACALLDKHIRKVRQYMR